ncbi:CAP domain-containing protein, partial [Leuconostoc palmae]|uniref:CAP domain-containing protein n=1 Tax=Leuconostoc palmae TaxID=501487 RepID=UPI001C7CA6E7
AQPAAASAQPAAASAQPAAASAQPAAASAQPAAASAQPAAASAQPAAASAQPAAASAQPVAASAQPVANSTAQALLNSLNAKRASLGLAPVSLDSGLTNQAQSRANNAVANGGLPTNHFQTNGEVVAIGLGVGSVVDAWYNETNMMTNGTPGHRMWVANPNATSVGFGVVGGTIVAESNVGQY